MAILTKPTLPHHTEATSHSTPTQAVTGTHTITTHMVLDQTTEGTITTMKTTSLTTVGTKSKNKNKDQLGTVKSRTVEAIPTTLMKTQTQSTTTMDLNKTRLMEASTSGTMSIMEPVLTFQDRVKLIEKVLKLLWKTE
jgi:hypothetical protein